MQFIARAICFFLPDGLDHAYMNQVKWKIESVLWVIIYAYRLLFLPSTPRLIKEKLSFILS